MLIPQGSSKAIVPVRKGLGSDIVAPTTPAAVAKTTPSSAIGSGQVGTGGTTVTTVTPLQVYQSEIEGDPGTQAAEDTFGATSSNLAAARADAIQRAVVAAGWTPQLSGSLASYAGDVTPQTIQQAQANPMSQAAQLNQQLQQATQNQPYDLAASGLGRSGAAAINQSNLQQQYQTGTYQGLNDLLNSISGAANTYASSYNDALQQLESAREAVTQRLQDAAGYSQSVVTTPDQQAAAATIDPTSNTLSPSQVAARQQITSTPLVGIGGTVAAPPAPKPTQTTTEAAQRAIALLKAKRTYT